MHNVWVLDLRSRPPIVAAHSAANNMDTFESVVEVLVTTFPEPHYTLVSEIAASESKRNHEEGSHDDA